MFVSVVYVLWEYNNIFFLITLCFYQDYKYSDTNQDNYFFLSLCLCFVDILYILPE